MKMITFKYKTSWHCKLSLPVNTGVEPLSDWGASHIPWTELPKSCLNTITLASIFVQLPHQFSLIDIAVGELYLVPVVVGLPVRPVRPLGGLVQVRPEPGAGVMRVVAALSRLIVWWPVDTRDWLVDTTIATHIGGGSFPEGGIFSNISCLEKSCFQPVVQT